MAGVLANLGVDMGDEFEDGGPLNPFGTFEDKEFFDLTNDILNAEELPGEQYRPLVEARKHKLLWGVKVPAMVLTSHYLLPMLDDVRIIVLRRKREECINSYMKTYHRGRRRAIDWFNNAIRGLAASLMEFDGPILDVEFEDLISDPVGVVSEVQSFIFEDWEDLDPAVHLQPQHFNNAVSHIRTRPRVEVAGWGNIALGVRIHRHPEPKFFLSWSAMISGGLRRGDTILMPKVGMPAHWAATSLAQEFMMGNPNHQTLLLVDDDMMFTPDALHIMRENRANWEYDAVMAFAVRKRKEFPTPVVMWHQGAKPEPESLSGDWFDSPPPEVKKGGIIETDAVGLAFTFIRRRVFAELVNEEWGLEHTDFFRYGPGNETEDIPFSRDLREHGFRMAIDASVRTKHIIDDELGWEDWQRILKRGRDNERREEGRGQD
jgi:hypothetical protein